jgi:putative addiction module killer protein
LFKSAIAFGGSIVCAFIRGTVAGLVDEKGVFGQIEAYLAVEQRGEAVDIKPIEVEIYETIGGKVPFSDWVMKLKNVQDSAQILLRLDRVKQGNLGDHKFIADGMFELRVDTGAGYRVYFGRVSDSRIVILWAGDKSTQARDIEKALGFWKDYRSREDA